jgi:monoamine oxidase
MTQQRTSPTSSDRVEFAIIGAGVSGLYTAWRLVCDRPQAVGTSSVKIFEASDRVGGRLLTWMPMGPSGGLRAELGGMRFFKEQELVWNLLKRLGLDDSIIEFPVKGPGLRLLLRGRSTLLNVRDPTKRYSLPSDNRRRQASAILERTVMEILDDRNAALLDRRLGGERPRSRQDWDTIKPYLRWRGQKLWEIGFWNLLSESLDSETYHYISDAFGYYSTAANWNAAEAMQDIALDANPEYKTLAEGMSALPKALAGDVEQAGGEIVMKTRLVKFESLGNGGPWRLSLKGLSEEESIVEAANLILALPRRSLELLAPSRSFDLEASPDLKRLIQSVRPVPAFKLFLFYRNRWWEQLQNSTGGRSVCDLPIRQTYYFAPDPTPTDAHVASCGLLMASYSDARAVDFWRVLAERDSNSVMRFVRLIRGLGLREFPPTLHMASPDMLRHAKAQLALLHRFDESHIPDPKFGAFADWGDDPIGGGWNLWEPKVDVRDAMRKIKIPLGEDHRVHIVGEAYSGVQGWVEGALTAAEKTLQTHLGLAPPGWLRDDYYLGW